LFEAFYSSIQLEDSTYILVGVASTNNNSDNQVWIVKTNKSGQEIWNRKFGTLLDEAATRVTTDIHGNIIVGAGIITGSNNDPWIIKLDSAGDLVSQTILTSGAVSCGGADLMRIPLSNEYLYWGCVDTVIQIGDYQYPRFIAIMDSSFNILAKAIFHGPTVRDIYIARPLPDSTFIVVGFKADETTGVPLGWITRVDNNGNILWEHFYYHLDYLDNYFADVQQAFDKGFICTGTAWTYYDSLGIYNQDIWLVKLDSNGCLDPNCFTNIGTIEVSDDKYDLQVFPNPASTQTTILYNVPPTIKHATIEVFDLTGHRLRSEEVNAGEHSLSFDVTTFSNAMLFVNLIVEGKMVLSKKILVIH